MSNAKDSSKKKVTAKANPVEAYGKPPGASLVGAGELSLRSDRDDDNKESTSFKNSGDEALLCGYGEIKADLDMHDNERNYHRMRPEEASTADSPNPEDYDYTQIKPAKGYGPKLGRLLPQGEDYED